jgi:hypothetical protein
MCQKPWQAWKEHRSDEAPAWKAASSESASLRPADSEDAVVLPFMYRYIRLCVRGSKTSRVRKKMKPLCRKYNMLVESMISLLFGSGRTSFQVALAGAFNTPSYQEKNVTTRPQTKTS